MLNLLRAAFWHLLALLPGLRALGYRPAPEGAIVFMAINGAGLGHLTRCLAVARRCREAAPEVPIMFLTTSIGVHLVQQAGFPCHHVCPIKQSGGIDVAAWNAHFCRAVEEVLGLYRPRVLVFDGSVPYDGLRLAIMRFRRRMRFVWIRRESFRASIDPERMRAHAALFDRIVVPTEWGESLQVEPGPGREHMVRVPPVVLLEPGDLLERGEALRTLGLDAARPVAYVQLGAGNINDIEDLQEQVVRALRALGLQVVLGHAPIALRPAPRSAADRIITDYPNSRFFRAFDFAVLAGGYNSVVESLALGLPAIFIPNGATVADDQTRRCEGARAFGRYEVLSEYSEEAFSAAVERMLRPAADQPPAVTADSGARAAARVILDQRA